MNWKKKLGECKIKPLFETSYNLLIERIKRRYGVNNWEALVLLKQLLEKANMREQTRKFIEQGERRRGLKGSKSHGLKNIKETSVAIQNKGNMGNQ